MSDDEPRKVITATGIKNIPTGGPLGGVGEHVCGTFHGTVTAVTEKLQRGQPVQEYRLIILAFEVDP